MLSLRLDELLCSRAARGGNGDECMEATDDARLPAMAQAVQNRFDPRGDRGCLVAIKCTADRPEVLADTMSMVLISQHHDI